MAHLTEDELEDAYIDWFAFNDEMWALEEKGYRHQFFGHDLGEDMGKELGSYVLVKDEFPHGDIVFTKKMPLPRTRKGLGLIPISMGTRRAAKAAAIIEQAGEGGLIELYSERNKWAAAVHPCARPGCEYQGSMFDQYGPHGHVEADTIEDALNQLFDRAPDWKLDPGVVDELVTRATVKGEFKHPLHSNPPFSGWRENWWLEKLPRDVTKIAYRRKRDALNVFMDWNQSLIDLAFNGPSQEHPPDSFDNFNSAYGLKGKRRITNFAKAVWFSLPAGGPYYLEDINVNMLNDMQPMLHNAEEQLLRIPDYAEERRLVDQEAAYWEEKYGNLLPESDDEVPF